MFESSCVVVVVAATTCENTRVLVRFLFVILPAAMRRRPQLRRLVGHVAAVTKCRLLLIGSSGAVVRCSKCRRGHRVLQKEVSYFCASLKHAIKRRNVI